jgi:hypothetical protein
MGEVESASERAPVFRVRQDEGMASLAEIAHELYALPPEEFTAARNTSAAAADDRELADAVRSLRKPAAAAWVLNLLAREEPDRLETLFELGARLRAAQESGDRAEFTALGRERRTATTELVAAGAELARGYEHPVGRAVLDLVTETLQAATIDPAAAGAVRAGVLVKPFESVGFEPVDLTDAVALETSGVASPRATPRPKLRVVKDPDAELRRARTEATEAVRDAEKDAADAEDAAAELASRARTAEQQRTELRTELEDLESELESTRAALARAEKQLHTLDRERGAAERAADRARLALERARARMAALE